MSELTYQPDRVHRALKEHLIRKTVTVRMRVPETFCAYFHVDGSESFHFGRLVEKDVVLFVREPGK